MSEGKQQTSPLQAAATVVVVGTSFAAASASTSQTETPAAGGEPEKRKRGRPRKPKPRAEQFGEPRPKRSRGRPRGSKNKLPSKVKAALLRESLQSRKGRLSKSEHLVEAETTGRPQPVSVTSWKREGSQPDPRTSEAR